ncbi:hypothetical protein BC830DRAFT_241578 [Chytriomyces sp. MP71]|nr:hypothetical protein BC830DRAFT_241578 [Chytriomyces sp. MP71]
MTLPRPSSISSTIHSILAATPIKLLSSWTGGSSATASPAITTASNHASQTAALASDATAAPHASAVAFASISHEEGFYAFTLGRDRRLRVYDLVTCSLVKSYSLVGHVLRDASLAFALDEATSNAGTTTSVSGVASGVAALGFSSNNKDNIGSELPLLPGVSPHSKGGSTVYMAGICNSIRIFGKTRIASKGGPHLRFKLAVYLHIPALPAVADSAPASGFVLFEGELNSEGGWRQMHILGTRGGLASSLLEGEVVKDFAIVQHRDDPAPSVGGARQLALDIEDDVAEIVGTLPTERFQIWVLTDNPYTRAAAAAVRASLVAWTDLRVRGIEDGAGARVEAAGGRWCVTAVRAAGPGVPPSVLDGRGMAAGRSPNDYYAAFVFDVARYSARTVLLALEEYVEQFGKGKELQELFLQRGAGAGYVDVQVLRALCKEVVAHYSLDVSNTNLADLGQIVAREWVQFAEICGDMAAAEHRALGLYAEEEPATAPAGAPFPRLVVVRRSRLGTVRFMDPCELVGHARDELLNGAGLNLLPTTYFEEREALLTARYGALPRVRGELLHLFEAVALVRTAVAGDDGGYAFLQACKTFVMEGVFAGGVDVAFKKVVMGKGDLFSGLKVAEFVTHMKRFDDAGAFFEAVLDLFAGKTGWDGGPMFGRDAVMDSGAAVQAHKLWVGASLLVETFAEVCAARLRLAEDVLLVLAAATAVPELDKLVERKVLAGALGAHQLCLVASTIAGLAVDVYESVAMEADMMDMDLFHSAKTAIVHTIPLSLLLSQTLCESKTPDPATSVEGRSLYLLQSVYSILSFFGLFSRDMKDDPLKLPPRLLVGAHVLAANGFAEAAWGLVELFPRDTYGAQYLEGYIKLKAGRFEEKAGRSDEMEKAFRQAASSFGSGGKVSDKQLATLLDESDVAGGVLGYYQHVIRLLEEARVHKMVTVFAKQALDSMSVKEKTEKRELAQRLWKTMFNHSLEAKEFVNAHMVLIGEKDPEVRKYSIRSFVTAVCESNETEALAERFSFGPLQFEVEETLLFKAKTRKVAPIPPRPGTNSTNVRNSDPNYHLILYSYYTSREDYRNGSILSFRRKSEGALWRKLLWSKHVRIWQPSIPLG